MNLRVHSLSIYCQNAIQKNYWIFLQKKELEESKNGLKRSKLYIFLKNIMSYDGKCITLRP